MSFRSISREVSRAEVIQWLSLGGLESLFTILETNGYDDLESISQCNESEQYELTQVFKQLDSDCTEDDISHILHIVDSLVSSIKQTGIDYFRLNSNFKGKVSIISKDAVEKAKQICCNISPSDPLLLDSIVSSPSNDNVEKSSATRFSFGTNTNNNSLTITEDSPSHTGRKYSAYSRPTSLFASNAPKSPRSPRRMPQTSSDADSLDAPSPDDNPSNTGRKFSAYARSTSLFANASNTLPKSPRSPKYSGMVDDDANSDISDLDEKNNLKHKRKQELDNKKILEKYTNMLKEGDVVLITEKETGENYGKMHIWSTPGMEYLVWNNAGRHAYLLQGFIEVKKINDVIESYNDLSSNNTNFSLCITFNKLRNVIINFQNDFEKYKEWLAALKSLRSSYKLMRTVSGWIQDDSFFLDKEMNKQQHKNILINGCVMRKFNETFFTTRKEAVRLISCPVTLDRVEWSDPSKHPRKALNGLMISDILGIYSDPNDSTKYVIMAAKRSLPIASLSQQPQQIQQTQAFIKSLRSVTSEVTSLV